MNGIIVIGSIVLLFLIAIFFINTYNKLKKEQIKVQEAESGIDIALTKRYDMLKKLFDVSKSFLTQEQKTIFTAIEMRSQMPMEKKIEAAQRIDLATKEISVVAEAYPQLSSQLVFKELQHGIIDAEDHLQAARRLYNANVSVLNQSIATIPTNIVAGLAGIKPVPMYLAEQHKLEDIELNFDLD